MGNDAGRGIQARRQYLDLVVTLGWASVAGIQVQPWEPFPRSALGVAVIDMTDWDRHRLNVLTDVSLDPENVRLAGGVAAATEADVIADLVSNEGVLDLVEGIATVGYLTHELPIVAKDAGAKQGWNAYKVVEGNRRLAALKLIQNPRLVPYVQSKVERLVQQLDRTELLEVEFIEAPDMDAANQLIAAIHTSNLRRSWQPARQAAFFEAQISNGHQYADLRSNYPTINVEKFVLYAKLRNAMEGVARSSSELSEVLALDSWRRGYSTLSRIFESKGFQALCGFSLDNNGHLRSNLTSDQQRAVWKVLLDGILNGGLNTRTLNSVKSPRFRQLIVELRDAVGAQVETDASEDPAEGVSGREGTSKSGGAQGGARSTGVSSANAVSPSSPAGTAGAAPTKATKKSTRPRRANFLPVDHLGSYDKLEVGVARLLDELSSLNVMTHTTTTHIVLRSVLERSIKAFADHVGEDIRSRVKVQNKRYLQLGDALEYLEDYLNKQGPTSLVQPVRKLRSNSFTNYTLTLDALNASSHNPNFQVDPDDVIDLWESIEGLLKELIKR